MKTQLTMFFALLALFMASCNSASKAPEVVSLDTIRAEIQKLEDAYSAAEKAKDVDGIVAYYSDDAISYTRNETPAIGKAAIKESIAARIAKDNSGNNSVYAIVDLFAEGNQAVEIGSWTTLDSAGKELEKGHYMSYFEKRNGKYLCVRDMSVNSMPPKP